MSSDGDVVYKFEPDFKQRIRNKSLVLKAKPFVSKAGETLSWLVRRSDSDGLIFSAPDDVSHAQQVRITFGTALFASIVLVVIAITVLLTSQSRDDRRDRGGGGGGGMFFRMPDIWLLSSPDPVRSEAAAAGVRELSLPEAIFSFVFGDGDPNSGFEERRWRALGRFIQSR